MTAIVTVADDGGGSGILREDLGMLPPGDIRNCILALANEEPALQELFEYRFREGRLSGQSFGNLMIAAMLGISGSFEEAIKRVSDIFAITGEVFPASNRPAFLRAELENGKIVYGESVIPQVAFQQASQIHRIWCDPPDAACPNAAMEKIREADVVILGPGSLFTSVIPPLLIENLAEAINASTAKIFYIANIMTQMGETDGFSPFDHMEAILRHTQIRRIDSVVVNTGGLDEAHTRRYAETNSVLSALGADDAARFAERGVELLKGDFISMRKGYVVHNAEAIAEMIQENFEKRYKH